MSQIKTDFWSTDMSDYSQVWYTFGDLMFKNEDDCHFREVLHDVSAYCWPASEEEEEKTTLKASRDFDAEFDTGDEEAEEEVAGPCSTNEVLKHVQANAFNLITQMSGMAALFKTEDFEEQTIDDKAYAFQQFGRTSAQIFVDLTGFQSTVKPAPKK